MRTHTCLQHTHKHTHPHTDDDLSLDFSQVLVMAPIDTHHAVIHMDVMDVDGGDRKRCGTCSMPLRDLHEQEERNEALGVNVRERSAGILGKFEPSQECKLFITATFTYSNILPARTEIYDLQTKQRKIETRLDEIKFGREEQVSADAQEAVAVEEAKGF